MPASAQEAVLCEGLKTVPSMVARCQYQDVNQSGPVPFSVLFVDHILWSGVSSAVTWERPITDGAL